MIKHLSLILWLTLAMTCLVLCQKQKSRFLSEVPIYDSAEYKIEMAKDRSGIQTYTRIYQTKDSIESVVAWYEEKLPDADKSTGVRSRTNSQWVKFEFEPEGADELSRLMKGHSREFVGVQIEKNPLNSATDIHVMEFLNP
jgi:hypothetical protein